MSLKRKILLVLTKILELIEQEYAPKSPEEYSHEDENAEENLSEAEYSEELENETEEAPAFTPLSETNLTHMKSPDGE